MRCFHVPSCEISDDRIRISGRELHHLVDVVRLREGDEITVLDGVGGTYEVTLVSCSRDVAIGEIKTRSRARPPLVRVTLCVGLPKAGKMDMVVQKATELDAHQIAPLLCQRTVPHLSAERAERRCARWRQISVEASKQSRRPFFPVISTPLHFDKALEEFHNHLELIFVPRVSRSIGPEGLKDVLKQNAGAREMSVFIGPEGGFTEDEVSRAISAGAVPVSLGGNILRTETAAIAALAIVLYERDAAGSKPDE